MTASDESLITDKDFDALPYKCKKITASHHIEQVFSPLRPQGWADVLKRDNSWDPDAMFILDGVYTGFRVVDPSADVPEYNCNNYASCFAGDNFEKLNNILLDELSNDKLSFSNAAPSQVHALGAIPKPNGSVRHITDCSRPKFKSLNNFMKSTFSSFSFNPLDDAILDVKPGSFMATIDLQDAYRSVPIHPENRKHFGLNWDFIFFIYILYLAMCLLLNTYRYIYLYIYVCVCVYIVMNL